MSQQLACTNKHGWLQDDDYFVHDSLEGHPQKGSKATYSDGRRKKGRV